MERALAEMDEAGVQRAVNCPAIWDLDSNDYAVEAATAHPERFATLGWIALDGTTSADDVDALMRRKGMLGLRFVMVLPALAARMDSGELDWLWDAANRRGLPVGLAVRPAQLPRVGAIAAQYPRLRLLVDHLAVGPTVKVPQAVQDVEALIALAAFANVAVKATGVPSMATDAYPFRTAHPVLRKVFDAYGADRMFWGTDITRMQCTWRECVEMFTTELPWLKGSDQDKVMGRGIENWIGWR
jgi:predicted TIM-barrel fold metal-dependent hydrolase